ncbi:MAG: hypothetical protein ACTSQP_23690, partial [Promethearchaeota archaeon]
WIKRARNKLILAYWTFNRFSIVHQYPHFFYESSFRSSIIVLHIKEKLERFSNTEKSFLIYDVF